MESASDIKCLSTDMSLHDALIEAHIHHHTRFPLIEGKDLHKVLGYVNFKDIVSALQVNPEDPTLKGICRPMMEVSPSDNVTALLSRLTKGYQHIAIVRDSEKTVGLVTLEDVVEAIVGDIHDEYDVLPSHIYKITHTRYLVGGGATLLALREKTGEDLPMVKLSLNDWMMQQLKRNPRVEDKLSHGGSCYIVRKVRRSQIYEVIIDKGVSCSECVTPSADTSAGI
jgi:putative hemolysin